MNKRDTQKISPGVLMLLRFRSTDPNFSFLKRISIAKKKDFVCENEDGTSYIENNNGK